MHPFTVYLGIGDRFHRDQVSLVLEGSRVWGFLAGVLPWIMGEDVIARCYKGKRISHNWK